MSNDGRENKGIIYITHKGELLIWLIIVLIFISFTTVHYMIEEKNDENDYQIFLQDVDGLIVGSPVRMMGIEVGHITKIKPMKDDMYVKFILTNPDVYIPRGTVATVEFSGMAASKSLELYLPDSNTYIDQNSPLIRVDDPKRLHDAMGLLNDMFDKLGSIISTSSSFGSKLNFINVKTGNDTNIEEFLEYSNKFLDDSNQKAAEFRKNLEGLKGNGKQVQ